MAREPYKKLIDVPLKPADSSVPLASKQLPENVMWLPDGRGFQKRPGTMPAAVAAADGVTQNFTGLGVVTTTARYKESISFNFNVPPPEIQATSDVDNYRDSSTVLAFRSPAPAIYPNWANPSSVVELVKVRGAQLGDNYAITRAIGDRSDPNYYLSTNMTAPQLIPYGTLLSGLALAGATVYNTFGQAFQPLLSMRPEQLGLGRKILNTNRLMNMRMTQNVPGPEGGLLGRGNSGRVDVVSNSSGAFIGGNGGPVCFWDTNQAIRCGPSVIRNPTTGTSNLNAALSAGALTGTYQYFFTDYNVTQNGEVYEGVADWPKTVVTAAQNVVLTRITGNGNESAKQTGTYGTTTSGTTSYMDIFPVVSGTLNTNVTSIGLKVGQNITFFLAGVRTVRTVVAIVGTRVKVNLNVTLPVGTTYISTGTGWRVYRTKAGGTTFYRLWDSPTSESSTFNFNLTDNILDSALTEEYIDTPFTRYGAPHVTQALCEHQGRNFALITDYRRSGGSSQSAAAVPPTVAYTSASSRHYWPIENAFELPSGCGDPRALISINDTLYVFTSNAIYYVQGTFDDATTYQVHTLTNEVGARDPRSVLLVGDTIYLVTNRGLAAVSGSSISYDLGVPVRKQLLEAGVVTASYYWPDKNVMLISANQSIAVNTYSLSTAFVEGPGTADGLTSTTYQPMKSRTLVYSFSSQRWAVWDIDCFNGGVAHEGDFLFIARETSGGTNIMRMSDACNWTDNGKAFTMRYYSEWLDNGMPMVDKSYTRLSVFATDEVDTGGQSYALHVTTQRDWTSDELDDMDVEDFAVSGYAGNGYASAPYADPSRPYKTIPLSTEKVKSLRIVLENSEPNGDICVTGMTLETSDSYENSKDY